MERSGVHGYDVARPSDLFIEFFQLNSTALIRRIGGISQGELGEWRVGKRKARRREAFGLFISVGKLSITELLS